MRQSSRENDKISSKPNPQLFHKADLRCAKLVKRQNFLVRNINAGNKLCQVEKKFEKRGLICFATGQ